MDIMTVSSSHRAHRETDGAARYPYPLQALWTLCETGSVTWKS
jgi:hypothetical protein